MNLLAIDTSTEACSVAVSVNDEVQSDHRLVEREHAARLLPMVSTLLGEFGITVKDLDGVVFGRGPGSFTGLRIAAAAAQGLALAADCGVHGVSSLQAIASAGLRQEKDSSSPWVMAAIDARMDQIYAGIYSTAPGLSVVSDELVTGAADFLVPTELVKSEAFQESTTPLLLCGSGAVRYTQELTELWRKKADASVRVIDGVFPHAADLLALTALDDAVAWKAPEHAVPVYLRDKVALTEKERLST